MAWYDFNTPNFSGQNQAAPQRKLIDLNKSEIKPEDQYGTAEQRAYAREMAKHLLTQKPEIKHWTQGVAHILNVLNGKAYRDQVAKAEGQIGRAPYQGAAPIAEPTGSTRPAIPQSEQPKLDALDPSKAAARPNIGTEDILAGVAAQGSPTGNPQAAAALGVPQQPPAQQPPVLPAAGSSEPSVAPPGQMNAGLPPQDQNEARLFNQDMQRAQPPTAKPAMPMQAFRGMEGYNGPEPLVQPGTTPQQAAIMSINEINKPGGMGKVYQDYRDTYKPQITDASKPQVEAAAQTNGRPAIAQFRQPYTMKVNNVDVMPGTDSKGNQVNAVAAPGTIPKPDEVASNPAGGYDALKKHNEGMAEAGSPTQNIATDYAEGQKHFAALQAEKPGLLESKTAIDQIRLLDKQDALPKGSAYSKEALEAARKLSFFTGGQFDPTRAAEVKEAAYAKLNAVAEQNIKQYGSANNLANIRSSNPNAVQTVAGREGVMQLAEQGLNRKLKFIDSLDHNGYYKATQLRHMEGEHYAKTPITIKGQEKDGVKQTPDVVIGNWPATPAGIEAFKNSVPIGKPGSNEGWFMYNGEIKQRVQ